eukprot:Em0022g781a
MLALVLLNRSNSRPCSHYAPLSTRSPCAIPEGETVSSRATPAHYAPVRVPDSLRYSRREKQLKETAPVKLFLCAEDQTNAFTKKQLHRGSVTRHQSVHRETAPVNTTQTIYTLTDMTNACAGGTEQEQLQPLFPLCSTEYQIVPTPFQEGKTAQEQLQALFPLCSTEYQKFLPGRNSSKQKKSQGLQVWIPRLNLLAEDNQAIEEGKWLSDRVINAAQELLKSISTSIGGLQNALLAQNLQFTIERDRGHAKYVKSRWLTSPKWTVASRGPDVSNWIGHAKCVRSRWSTSLKWTKASRGPDVSTWMLVSAITPESNCSIASPSEKFLGKKGQESGKNGKILARMARSWQEWQDLGKTLMPLAKIIFLL